MDSQTAKYNGHVPEREKMQALGRLSAKISHDLNNILGAIEGYATLIMNSSGADSPFAPDLLEIRASVAKAAGILRKLAVFGGRQILNRKLCPVNTVIEAACKREELSRAGKFRIETRLSPGLPDIMVDEAKLDEALVNLLVNACEAMSGVGMAVVSSALARRGGGAGSPAAHRDEDLTFVKISVRDRGAGISADVLDHLFEPMFSRPEKGAGAGMGLAVVYAVAAQHNGWVEVKSGSGRGSEFSLFLPISPL